jgi:Na+-driven multidrug efflux pump
MTAEPHISRPRPTGQLQLAAALLALAIIVGILFVWISGAWTAGFSGADEPAHFLNSYFIAEYLRTGFGSNPLAFATEFYLTIRRSRSATGRPVITGCSARSSCCFPRPRKPPSC